VIVDIDRIGSSVLILGTADWNQSIATNQHYAVRELAELAPVTFVESQGLRRPHLHLRDIRRILRRLRNDAAEGVRGRPVPNAVSIVSPRVIPVHSGIAARINSWLLPRYAGPWLASEDRRILWTYTPVTYGLEDHSDRAIYHCVDLLGQVEGIDAKVIDRAERTLAAKGVQAVASSRVVAAHLEGVGFENVIYWPNVADVELFEEAADNNPQDRSGVIFAGNFSDRKVDFGLLRRIVDQGVELHLAGPISEGGGSSRGEMDKLTEAGAIYHGPLSLGDLARVLAQRRVGLIPYVLNDYTRGVSPLKTFEYLAAGLAVVSTDLPGVDAIDGLVTIAPSEQTFVDAVVGAVHAADGKLRETAREAARAHSWSNRGAQMRLLASS
jgi:glycosyltransferase involved in cell wall biosynthesis